MVLWDASCPISGCVLQTVSLEGMAFSIRPLSLSLGVIIDDKAILVFGALPGLMQPEAESLQAWWKRNVQASAPYVPGRCNPASMLLIRIHTRSIAV